MSRDARVELEWADGTYSFRLGWGELIKLQEAVDAGPFYLQTMFLLLAHALANPEGIKDFKIEYIREVIRWGLIGGGMPVDDARKLVKTYVEDMPPAENLDVAARVLTAALKGAPDETLGEAEGEAETESTTSPEESSE